MTSRFLRAVRRWWKDEPPPWNPTPEEWARIKQDAHEALSKPRFAKMQSQLTPYTIFPAMIRNRTPSEVSDEHL